MKSAQRHIFENITQIYIIAMLTIYLLYTGFGGYEMLTSQKWQVFAFISGGYLAIMLLVFIELIIIGQLSIKSPIYILNSLYLQDKIIIGFFICSLISTIFSINFNMSFWGGVRYEGLLTIFLYCFCFIMISHFGLIKKYMIWIFSIVICIEGILVFIQLLGYNPLRLYPDGMNYYDANKLYSGQFLGTIGNVDILSAVLCISIPLFWMYILKKSGKIKFLVLIPLLISIFILKGAWVEGGILGSFGAILLTIPLIPKNKRIRNIFTILIILICILSIIFVYAFGGHFSGFIYEASELLHGRLQDKFGSSRIFIWRNVLKLVPEHLLFGGGPDTLGLRMDVGFERYDETLGILIQSSIDVAHNEYLNILVNQGLLAFIFYILFLIYTAFQWIRKSYIDNYITILGTCALGYCIQAFFGISSPISAPYFWIVLGLLTHRIQYVKEK